MKFWSYIWLLFYSVAALHLLNWGKYLFLDCIFGIFMVFMVGAFVFIITRLQDENKLHITMKLNQVLEKDLRQTRLVNKVLRNKLHFLTKK